MIAQVKAAHEYELEVHVRPKSDAIELRVMSADAGGEKANGAGVTTTAGAQERRGADGVAGLVHERCNAGEAGLDLLRGTERRLARSALLPSPSSPLATLGAALGSFASASTDDDDVLFGGSYYDYKHPGCER